MLLEFERMPFTARVYLCRGPADWKELMAVWQKDWVWPHDNAGHMGGGVSTIIPGVYAITFMRGLRNQTPAERAGIVAHECLHALDRVLHYAGETNPGEETRAYLLQALVEWVYNNMRGWK